MNTNRWPAIWTGKDVLSIFLSVIAPLSVVLALLLLAKPKPEYATIVFDATFIVAVAVSVWYWAKHKGISAKDIGLSSSSFKTMFRHFLYALAGGVVVIVVGGGLSTLLSEFLEISAGNIIPEMLAGPLWLTVLDLKLFAGLLMPFVEELFFRGVLFNYLRSRTTFLYAALISTLVFSAVHFSVPMLPFTFMLGFTSAFLFEKTKSLTPSIFLHIVVNTFAANLAILGLL